MKITNLDAVRDTALAFLHIDISETRFSPMVVHHPIFESGIVYHPISRKMVNILEDKAGLKDILNYYESKIMKSNDLIQIYMIIRASYRLTFVMYIKDDLSADDFSNLLSDAWVSSENPNQDVNVSLKQAAKMFRQADKKILMDKDEYEVYETLPEKFTVYRGVAVGRNPKGMSWTRNIETAEWFANRFNIGEDIGYVQAATAYKKDVLAYFNSRDEDELVISTESLHDIHTI